MLCGGEGARVVRRADPCVSYILHASRGRALTQNEEQKYRILEKSANVLQKEAKTYLDSMRGESGSRIRTESHCAALGAVSPALLQSANPLEGASPVEGRPGGCSTWLPSRLCTF